MIQQLFSQLCKTRKLTMRTMLHICCTFCLTVALVKNVLTMTLHKAWVEQHWCKSVAKPHWPFSYQRNLHQYSSIIKGIPTCVCNMGFVGMINEDGDFNTCHLKIKVPDEFEEYTLTYIILLSLFGLLAIFIYWRVKKYLRRRYLLKKAERRRSRKSSESSEDKGPTARARRSSETIGR